MDPLSITTGVAALFGTCLNIVEKVDAIREAGASSRAAMVRFETDKLLLAQWGKEVGIEDGVLLPTHHESLDDPAVAAMVTDILGNISDICLTIDSSLKGLAYRPVKPTKVVNGDLGPGLESLRRAPHDDLAKGGLVSGNGSSAKGSTSKMAKVGWALGGQARVAPKLDQLGNLIKSLFKVVPISDSALRKALEYLQKQRESKGRFIFSALLFRLRLLHLTALCLRYLATKCVWDTGLLLGEREVLRALIALAVDMLGALGRQPENQAVPALIADMVHKILDPRKGIWSSLHPHVWRLFQHHRSTSRIAKLWYRESLGGSDSGQGMIGDNALCFAAWIGRDALRHISTEAKIPINTSTQDGWTALHIACMREGGGESLVKLLVECGADVNAQTTTNGDTALMVATYKGRVGEARLLLDAGAKLLRTKRGGYTPLLSATMGGYVELVRLLLDRGADLAVTNVWKETALHLAYLEQRNDVAALLLDRGADVTKRCSSGNVPLHRALWRGQELWSPLLEKAAGIGMLEVNTSNTIGETLLHAAILGANPASSFAGSAAEALLDLGADVEARSDTGNTALTLAAARFGTEWLQGLLDRGAKVDAPGGRGRTPLHAALLCGNTASASLFLARGADLALKDGDGCVAGHFAAKSNKGACLRLVL
ncbi:hypothetical protein RB601_008628 [Gaeumannomyces tritici]